VDGGHTRAQRPPPNLLIGARVAVGHLGVCLQRETRSDGKRSTRLSDRHASDGLRPHDHGHKACLAVDDGAYAYVTGPGEGHRSFVIGKREVERRCEPCRGLRVHLVAFFVVPGRREAQLLADHRFNRARCDFHSAWLWTGRLGLLSLFLTVNLAHEKSDKEKHGKTHRGRQRSLVPASGVDAGPSVSSISVPHGSVMNTIRRPDALVLLRIAASV